MIVTDLLTELLELPEEVWRSVVVSTFALYWLHHDSRHGDALRLVDTHLLFYLHGKEHE